MNKVLVCIDGSQYSQSCCEYAGWAASELGAAIEVVYVTDLRQFEVPFIADLSGSLGLQPYQSIMGELQSLEDRKAKIILEQGVGSIRKSGFEGEISTSHKTGFLVDSLSELEQDSELIVVGKRGENANFAAEHLGSTMERVVRAAERPCLVSSRSFQKVEKVLFAYQNVESCHAAIAYLKDTRLFANVELHLASVARNDDESDTLADLKKAEAELKSAGIEVVCQMLHGIVPQALARYAQESGIDMLIMGAYGHSRIRHLIIGSTTTEILRDCRLPTLLFR
ncbi:universal stress protein [Pelagicoccus sp. SDUM812003]|uniref:universal stress protein n=1 Tax=Pelagicoccus sp. SDUM812003 TaxID=3041267 RepID=UPI00280E7F94|nr:universal stress protein [Pelagicoccus sp. SDUM812003]MDQ8205419.1 universal stress protein [Pelagicoccus sp. SDUM812003]